MSHSECLSNALSVPPCDEQPWSATRTPKRLLPDNAISLVFLHAQQKVLLSGVWSILELSGPAHATLPTLWGWRIDIKVPRMKSSTMYPRTPLLAFLTRSSRLVFYGLDFPRHCQLLVNRTMSTGTVRQIPRLSQHGHVRQSRLSWK